MSEIKNRIKSDIIAARKKRNEKELEVLAFVLDRIQETERTEFIRAKSKIGSDYQPTFEEVSKRCKALSLEEEARVVMNTIRNYEEEIKAFERMKFMAEATAKRNVVSKLNTYLSDLRKDPDQLDIYLLDLCIQHDIITFDDIPKAMKVTAVELCFEDQSVIYNKLKALFK